MTVVDWTTLETARIQIAAWQRLKPQLHDRLNPRKVRAVVRRRLRYGTPTEAIRQALRLLEERPA